MTTIMGICCKDGIVMGSDTKEVSGTMKMSRKEKIYSYTVGSRPVLIATAGEVETIKQAVTRIDPSQMGLGEEPTLEEYLRRIVAPQISFLGREHIGTYGEVPNLELLIGAVGPKIAKVYADGKYDIENRFFSAGSGSIFAEVLLRRFYNPEITLELGKRLVGYLIWEMQTVDNFSGGDMVIYTLNKENKVEKVDDYEIEVYKHLPKLVAPGYQALLGIIKQMELSKLKDLHKELGKTDEKVLSELATEKVET